MPGFPLTKSSTDKINAIMDLAERMRHKYEGRLPERLDTHFKQSVSFAFLCLERASSSGLYRAIINVNRLSTYLEEVRTTMGDAVFLELSKSVDTIAELAKGLERSNDVGPSIRQGLF